MPRKARSGTKDSGKDNPEKDSLQGPPPIKRCLRSSALQEIKPKHVDNINENVKEVKTAKRPGRKPKILTNSPKKQVVEKKKRAGRKVKEKSVKAAAKSSINSMKDGGSEGDGECSVELQIKKEGNKTSLKRETVKSDYQSERHKKLNVGKITASKSEVVTVESESTKEFCGYESKMEIIVSESKRKSSPSKSKIMITESEGMTSESESKRDIARSDSKMKSSGSESKMKSSGSESKIKNSRSESKLKSSRSESKMKSSGSESKMEISGSEIKMEISGSESKVEIAESESKMKIVKSDSKRNAYASKSKVEIAESENKIKNSGFESKMQIGESESKRKTFVSKSKMENPESESKMKIVSSENKMEIVGPESNGEIAGSGSEVVGIQKEVIEDENINKIKEPVTEGNEAMAAGYTSIEQHDSSSDENPVNSTFVIHDVKEDASISQMSKSPKHKQSKIRRTYFVSCYHSDDDQRKEIEQSELGAEFNEIKPEILDTEGRTEIQYVVNPTCEDKTKVISVATCDDQQRTPEVSDVGSSSDPDKIQKSGMKKLDDVDDAAKGQKRRRGKLQKKESDIDNAEGTEEPITKKKGRIKGSTATNDNTKTKARTKAIPQADLDLKMKMLKITQTRKNKYIGAHVSISGSLCNAISDAVLLGARAFAMFLKSQRQWSSKPLEKQDADIFKTLLQEYGFSPSMVVPHGSYLMNCGSPNKEILDKSRAMLVNELKRCEMLGLDIFNFHPGSSCGQIPVEESVCLIAESINIALEQTKHVTAVIENMSCQGHTVGGKFNELAGIIERVKDKLRIGICLDTCHMFAAGYDIKSEDGYEKVMNEFDEVVGFKYLKAVHLNDSKGKLGCHRDLHANIGKGEIGVAAFKRLMNDARFDNIPMILETPQEDYSKEIKLLNTLMD